MGYTHYWYRKETIEASIFKAIVSDFKQLIPQMELLGVKLAGPLGKGKPELTNNLISFNGPEDCGHPKNASVMIPWPSSGATSIGDSKDSISGQWFAGALLSARTCNGDCSYETCYIPRVVKPNKWEPTNRDKIFACCKTAYRPYDWAVTAALIVFKHHLKDACSVSSDGEDEHWEDGRRLVQTVLGYGAAWHIFEGELHYAPELIGA